MQGGLPPHNTMPRALTGHCCYVLQASVAEVMASMAPCARLYAFLGCTLAAAHSSDPSRHPYSHWLDTYSAESSLVRSWGVWGGVGGRNGGCLGKGVV
jgi:thiaminase